MNSGSSSLGLLQQKLSCIAIYAQDVRRLKGALILFVADVLLEERRYARESVANEAQMTAEVVPCHRKDMAVKLRMRTLPPDGGYFRRNRLEQTIERVQRRRNELLKDLDRKRDLIIVRNVPGYL